MHKVKIIAEAGVNHNGSLDLAKKMVDVAKEAGADYVKFQTFRPEKLASRFAEKANYQKETTDRSESQQEMLRKLILSDQEYVDLSEYCKKKNIGFISTPFEIDSLKFLFNIDMDFWKIPSGEVTNYPFLVEVAKTSKPVVLSTGMSNLEEVKQAVRVLKENGTTRISLLHCNTQYPTPYEDVNLSAMITLKETFGCEVGYSDHTPGIEIPIAAVAMGATIIEKHFTLDRNMEGPDHKASLEPNELKAMIDAIRHIAVSLGSGVKQASGSEIANIGVVRKSIVAARTIKKGDIFSNENLTTKRPGTGISPMEWNNLLGQPAIKDFEEDELIILK